MKLDLTDASFASMIAGWLRDLSDDVIGDPTALFEQSPGVYPTTLLPLWRKELARRHIEPRDLPTTAASEDVSGLPVSHPADADWRFTPQSAVELARRATQNVPGGEVVVHIGTPSTFLRCVVAATGHQHVLLDRNTAVLDALADRIRPPNLMLGIDLHAITWLRLGAGAAIVDPPWYPEDTLSFLTVAAQACRPAATVLLCQPTIGTRPGVAQERDQLLESVAAVGLELSALRSGAVRYATPHFEAVSLQAAAQGFPVPVSWRKGDVLELTRTDSPPAGTAAGTGQREWREVRFGPVRLKLAQEPTGPDLGRITPQDVLPTVSRRDPLRTRIGLWTSGNRVFTLQHPDLITDLIARCERDRAAGQFTLSHTVTHAQTLGVGEDTAVRLFQLLRIELDEHPHSGGPTDERKKSP